MGEGTLPLGARYAAGAELSESKPVTSPDMPADPSPTLLDRLAVDRVDARTDVDGVDQFVSRHSIVNIGWSQFERSDQP